MDDYRNDIERYIAGDMTPAEMHRLEKLALSDPFLTDALEGAMESAAHFKEDVSELDQRIQTSPGKNNVWFTPVRIAASFVLLLVSGFILWGLFKPVPPPLMAKQEPKRAPIVTPELKKSDTTPEKKSPPQLLAMNKPPAAKRNEPVAAAGKQNKPTAAEPDFNTTSAASPALAEKEADKVKGEEIVASDETRVAVRDEVDSASPGAPPQTLHLDRVSGAGAVAGSSLASRKKEASTAAVPAGGLEEFNTYLRKNARYPQRAADKKIRGSVVIQFTVRRDSTLSNFEILQGIGYGCDEEVIRLIKEGPKWLPERQGNSVRESKERVEFAFRND